MRLAVLTIILISSLLSSTKAKVVEPSSHSGSSRDGEEPVANSPRQVEQRGCEGGSVAELDAAFEKLKEELAEVELMKAEIANIAGGGSDAIAALASARSSNDALRKELNEINTKYDKLASSEVGEAVAKADQLLAENENLRVEHAKMSDAVESLAKEAASLQTTLLEAKNGDPDEKARMEVAHLSASIHDLSRVNINADSTLAAIKKQSEEDVSKLKSETSDLRSELASLRNKNFDAECKELRDDAANVKNELILLKQLSDREAETAAKKIEGLKVSLEISKKLQIPTKECTIEAPHEGAAGIKIERLSKALSAAQESSAAHKEHAELLQTTNAQLKGTVATMQDQVTNAKKIALDEAMGLQMDISKLMSSARAEVDLLTARLGKATANAQAHATAVNAIKTELNRQRELDSENSPEGLALAHALSLMLNSSMPRRDQILQYQETSKKVDLGYLSSQGSILDPPSHHGSDAAESCDCLGKSAHHSNGTEPASLSSDVLNKTLKQLQNSTTRLEKSMAEASLATTELTAANLVVADLQEKLKSAGAKESTAAANLASANLVVTDLQEMLKTSGAETATATTVLDAANLVVADLREKLKTSGARESMATADLAAGNLVVADLHEKLNVLAKRVSRGSNREA